MGRELVERYRRWFEYERDSHAKVLVSLDTVPGDHRDAPAFAKAVELMAHVVAARMIWLERFGVVDLGAYDFFPKGLTLAELADRVRAMEAAWSGFLETLDDAALARVFDYRDSVGDPYRNTVEDILTQLFGHSWYHRGQVATLVRAAGGTPAVTDFVYWTREPLSSPPA
jgi:uncharacterized damage-inducible protein DinB